MAEISVNVENNLKGHYTLLRTQIDLFQGNDFLLKLN